MAVDTYEKALDMMVCVLVDEFNEAPAGQPVDLEYEILWPNVEAEEPIDELWMRLTMLPASQQRASLGPRARFRVPGLFVIQVFGPVGGGETPILELIDRLTPVVRGQNYDGLVFEQPAPIRVGPSAKHVQYNLNAPFRFDAIGGG